MNALGLPEGFKPTQLKCAFCECDPVNITYKSEGWGTYAAEVATPAPDKVAEWVRAHAGCAESARKARAAGWRD